MKFHIIIYGCQMNYSDSARIKAVLHNCWWEYVEEKSEADIVILDTCSVRQKSEDKVRWELKELRKLDNAPKVRLTGCMIQHNLNLKKTRTTKSKKYQLGNFVGNVATQEPILVGIQDVEEDKKLKDIVRDFVKWTNDVTDNLLYINHAFNPLFKQMQTEFPQVELFFRINDVGMLPYVIAELWYEWIRKADIEIVNEYQSIIPHSANQIFAENTKTAYVPISSGCSQFCAYCIVPYARGLEKNRPVDEILTEIKHHIQNGVEEIVLLGQIVNKHPDFYEILKSTCETPGVRWVRYTSPYPTYYDEKIFDLHDKVENLCPHIHMPLQSWSTAVLKKMFRGYTADQYKKFVDQIRGLSRPISLTSDIIVWFTDETEQDFQESLSLSEYARFDMIYIGIYSPRPGTYGARKYEDNIPQKIKKERHHRLNDLLINISKENNLSEIWTHREMIVREVQDEMIVGYTDNMKNVGIAIPKKVHTTHEMSTSMWFTDSITPGQFLNIKIIDTWPFNLLGEIIDG